MRKPRFRQGQQRGLPRHLDTGLQDFNAARNLEGVVKAVYAKDNTANLTGGKYTTYQVECYFPDTGYKAVLNSQARYLGNGGNGTIAKETPLLVGQPVLVGFIGADPNNPVILGVLPDASLENSVSQEQAEHPQQTQSVNGVVFQVDKDGNYSIQIPAGKTITIQDRNGATLLKVTEGGTVSLDNLLKQAFGTQLAADFTTAAAAVLGSSPDVSAAFTTLASSTTTNTTNNSTSQTEAS